MRSQQSARQAVEQKSPQRCNHKIGTPGREKQQQLQPGTALQAPKQQRPTATKHGAHTTAWVRYRLAPQMQQQHAPQPLIWLMTTYGSKVQADSTLRWRWSGREVRTTLIPVPRQLSRRARLGHICIARGAVGSPQDAPPTRLGIHG